MKKRNIVNISCIRYLYWSIPTCEALHWENCIFISFQFEWDMIVVTVFLPIFNQMELHFVQNREEYFHQDHILFNLKGNENTVFSVYTSSFWKLLTIRRTAIRDARAFWYHGSQSGATLTLPVEHAKSSTEGFLRALNWVVSRGLSVKMAVGSTQHHRP